MGAVRCVYVVHHVHEFENGADDVKLIGVYSSSKKANLAVDYLKGKVGFSAYPEGFHVQKFELNKEQWTEGFVTVT